MQERFKSIANALELCLSCTNPSICGEADMIWCGNPVKTFVLVMLNLFKELWRYIHTSYHFQILGCIGHWSLSEKKDSFILNGQYHGCWWLSDTRSQGYCCIRIMRFAAQNWDLIRKLLPNAFFFYHISKLCTKTIFKCNHKVAMKLMPFITYSVLQNFITSVNIIH